MGVALVKAPRQSVEFHHVAAAKASITVKDVLLGLDTKDGERSSWFGSTQVSTLTDAAKASRAREPIG